MPTGSETSTADTNRANSAFDRATGSFRKPKPPETPPEPRTISGSGKETAPSQDGSSVEDRPPAGKRKGISGYTPTGESPIEVAQDLLRHIGERFVELRENGRSQAWAELENEVMRNGHLLISTGLLNAKDWVAMAIEIEGFRKSESGTAEKPGDFLARWLSEAVPRAKMKPDMDKPQ